jgi:subtilisin family serine protease
MKARVTTFLNLRVGTPEILPHNNPGDRFFRPGDIIDIAETVLGDSFKGNNIWYRLTDGGFIWSGGVVSTLDEKDSPGLHKKIKVRDYINERLDGSVLRSVIDYNLLLDVDTSIKQTKGKGITIGIMDHPISKISFKHPVLRPFSIDHPFSTHATFIAGIIAGNSTVLGISPEVRLVELPIYDENGIPHKEFVKRSLEFVNSVPGPFILNVSQKIPSSFREQVMGLNKIIVASAGMDDALLNNTDLLFPANLPSVISVGAISSDFHKANKTALWNMSLDYVLPNFRYASFSVDENTIETAEGDSFATAVISALVALLFASGRINNDLSNLKEELTKVARSYADSSAFDFLNPLIPV